MIKLIRATQANETFATNLHVENAMGKTQKTRQLM